MKAIGFANKFYTLWDIDTQTRYTGTQDNYRPFAFFSRAKIKKTI